jgi:hypothetical protein
MMVFLYFPYFITDMSDVQRLSLHNAIEQLRVLRKSVQQKSHLN